VADGQAAGVSVPTSLGEGSEQAKPAKKSEVPPPEQAPARDEARARELQGAADPSLDAPPDPEPLSRTKQWRYEIGYEKGRVAVRSVAAVQYRSPVVTARRMGRYAIELWIGKELIDRVRFDFPLLAAEEAEPGEGVPSLAAGAVVTRSILVPDSERATSAVLIDRATGERIDLSWPPDAGDRVAGGVE
jgi:hypothetical protein